MCGNERQPTPAVVTSPADAHLSCHPHSRHSRRSIWKSLSALPRCHTATPHAWWCVYNACVTSSDRFEFVKSGPSGPTGRFTRCGDGARPLGSGRGRVQRPFGESAVAHSGDATRCSGLDASVSKALAAPAPDTRGTRDGSAPRARTDCGSGQRETAIDEALLLAVRHGGGTLKRFVCLSPDATGPERSVCER